MWKSGNETDMILPRERDESVSLTLISSFESCSCPVKPEARFSMCISSNFLWFLADMGRQTWGKHPAVCGIFDSMPEYIYLWEYVWKLAIIRVVNVIRTLLCAYELNCFRIRGLILDQGWMLTAWGTSRAFGPTVFPCEFTGKFQDPLSVTVRCP